MTTIDLVRVEIVQERVCVVTLLDTIGDTATTKFPWGTAVAEHRLNFPLIAQLNLALDAALANPRIASVVVANDGKFFSNGMDLDFIASNMAQADALQKQAELLLARLLCFPLPTVAAISGHFCAAGAMFGMAFDYRVMSTNERGGGLFFVPGVDIGLTYSPGMTLLLKSKLPVHMHTDAICFAQRYRAADLQRERVVVTLVQETSAGAGATRLAAVQHALELTHKGRFLGAKYRETLHNIKRQTFKDAHNALTDETKVFGMGFEAKAWGEGGKARI